MALPQVGAQATLGDLQGFLSGAEQINQQFAKIGRTATTTSGQVNQLGTALGKVASVKFDPSINRFRDMFSGKLIAGKDLTQFNSSLQQTGSSAQQVGKGIGIADIAIGSFVASVAQQAIGAVTGLANSLFLAEDGFIRTAARADELTIVARYVGASYGQTTVQVDEQVKAIQAAGIRYDMAARAVVDMTEAQLDMSKSTELVKIAQASAIKSSQDSSATLQQIIYGIRTLQPEMLRTAGITTSLDEAMAMYVDEAGNHVKAVTGQQKQQALFNAVLQKGSGLLGLYDVAMQEPEKRLRSLDRITYEISRTAGAAFKPAFGAVVDVLETFNKTLLASLVDGGSFHSLLTNLGAGTSVLFEGVARLANDGFKNLVAVLGDTTTTMESAGQMTGRFAEDATNVFVTAKEGILSQLSATAESALSWGINVMAEFAGGLVQGAADALTQAMDFIGGLLSSWLSAGSPPKVAPDIDQWGAAAMSEYLRGFGEADFSALDAVQGPLKSILDLTGEAGQFTGLTMDLTAALAEFSRTGQVTGDIFQRLSQVGGQYGIELEKLARLQFDLAAASKKTEQTDADYAAAQDEVNKLTEEYNSLLEDQAAPAKTGLVGGYDKGRYRVRAYAAGAGPETAAKAKALEEAKARLAAADAARRAAKEQEDNLKRQVMLQDKLLKQIIEMAQLQAKLAKDAVKAAAKAKAEKPKAAGGKAAPEMPVLGGIGIPKIGPLVNEELDKAKAAISDKLGELFAPLRAKWEESIKPALDGLVAKFEWFKGIVVDSWKKLEKELQPVVDFIKGLIPPDVAKQLGEFAGVLLVIGVAAGVLIGVGAIILAIVTPVTLLIAGIAALYVLIRNQGPKIVATWKSNWEMLKAIVTGVWKNIVAKVTEIRDGVVNKFKEIRKGVEDAILSVRDGMVGKFTEIKASVEGAVVSVREAIVSKFEEARAGVSNAIASIRDGVVAKFEEIKASISAALTAILESFGVTDELKTRWGKIWEDVKLIAETLLSKVQDAITGKLSEVSITWTQKIDWLRAEFERIASTIILSVIGFALGVYNIIMGKVNELSAAWTQKIDWLRSEFDRIASNIILSVMTFGWNVYNTIVGKINELLAWWTPKWMEFKAQAETIWGQIVMAVALKILDIYNAITGKITEIKNWITGQVTTFVQLGSDVIGGIILGIQNKAAEFLAAFTGMIEGAVNAVKAKLGIGSPSLVFAGFGQDMVAGLGVGVQTTLPVVIAMFDAVTAAGAVLAGLLSGILTSAVNVAKASADEFNRVLGGAAGTIEDLDRVKGIAGGSMGSIGEPLQAAFFVLRDGAAEAGSATGGVVNNLESIKAMNGMVTNIYVFTYEQTIRLPDVDRSGGGGGAGTQGGVRGRQHGGWVNAGAYRLHANEFVLSQAMRMGQQAIPAAVLSPKAMMQLAAVQARNGGAAIRNSYQTSSVNNRSVNVEVNPTYREVETPSSIYYDVVSALAAARV